MPNSDERLDERCHCGRYRRDCDHPVPLLAQDAAEAQRMTYAGRKTELLKSAKIFDSSRLEDSPLFEPTKPKLF